MRARLAGSQALSTRSFDISGKAQKQLQYPKRCFLTAPTPRSLTLTRTIPYEVRPVYDVIADISSYSTFIPYCTTSMITARTKPDVDGRTWPTESRLAVTWRGLREEWVSQVQCIPNTLIEAKSGNLVKDPSTQARNGLFSVVRSLRASWTLQPMKSQGSGRTLGFENQNDDDSLIGTTVKLEIEYAFANVMYETMGATFVPEVAGRIMKAFEKRVHELLARPPSALR